MSREVPVLDPLVRRFEQIPDMQRRLFIEADQTKGGMEESDIPWTKLSEFGVGERRLEFGIDGEVEAVEERAAGEAGGKVQSAECGVQSAEYLFGRYD